MSDNESNCGEFAVIKPIEFEMFESAVEDETL